MYGVANSRGQNGGEYEGRGAAKRRGEAKSIRESQAEAWLNARA